ncbi:hypothetical protein D3C71_1979270 [compost metagenome]
MPRETAERFAVSAAALGIKVTPPASVMVDPQAPMAGIRLCLGGPSLDELTEGLTLLARLLREEA